MTKETKPGWGHSWGRRSAAPCATTRHRKGAREPTFQKRTTVFLKYFRTLEIEAWEELFEETNGWLKRKNKPSVAVLEK